MARKWAWVYVDARWKRLCAQVYEEETHCRYCGGYVDQRIPARRPMSKSVDHILDLDRGGAPFDRDNAGLAHYGCNSRAGAVALANKRHAERRARTPAIIRGTRVHVQGSEL